MLNLFQHLFCVLSQILALRFGGQDDGISCLQIRRVSILPPIRRHAEFISASFLFIVLDPSPPNRRAE
jgi:hypothetical protein